MIEQDLSLTVGSCSIIIEILSLLVGQAAVIADILGRILRKLKELFEFLTVECAGRLFIVDEAVHRAGERHIEDHLTAVVFGEESALGNIRCEFDEFVRVPVVEVEIFSVRDNSGELEVGYELVHPTLFVGVGIQHALKVFAAVEAVVLCTELIQVAERALRDPA